MFGFIGKLLRVDLTSGQVSEERLSDEFARKYIGGSALACRYLYDLASQDAEPLAPDNPLVFLNGPLTGINLPSCGRYTVCARSPLTNLWGEANSGGRLGPMLKFAGFDGLIFTGASEQPVYLEIIEGKAVLKDARAIWGLDCYQTQEKLKEITGRNTASVACIGPAGERLSKISGIVNDAGRTAARTGLGAVMGSKKLKAVLAYGTQTLLVADEAAFQKVASQAYHYSKSDVTAEMFRLGGTSFYTDIGMMYGDIPVKYFSEGEFDVSKINAAALADTIYIGQEACYRCPIACGRRTKIERYGVASADGPEYETIAAFGPMLKIDDLPGIAYAGHLCNRYGLDTISVGSTIALACTLYEKGVLQAQDLGGMALKWGDIQTVIALIEAIAYRKGIGNALADGSLQFAKRYGAEDSVIHVKGLELAMHDPRAFSGQGVSYATAPRGGCHLEGDYYFTEMGVEAPGIGITSAPREEWAFSSEQKVFSVVHQQDWRSISDALVMCKFATFPVEMVCRMLNTVTGYNLAPQEMILTGERITNLKRLLNLRFGLLPKDDKLPKAFNQPLPSGGAKGNKPDFDDMLAKYYEIREWDKNTGMPSENKLGLLDLP